jgi:CelD/BcsL family acetyltransferase involved in cellulose biosynthesis
MSAAAAIPAECRIKSYPTTEWPRLAPAWSELVRNSGGCSFFLTEPWVDTWLEVYGRTMETSILVAESGRRPIGACLLVKARQNRVFVPITRVSLNASGEPATETTYIEFNDLVCRAGWETRFAEAVAAHLSEQDWDELAFDGFREGPAFESFKEAFEGLELEEVRHPSYYADLAAIRRAGTPYEMALGKTNRKHLRQNIRYHSEQGPLRLEAASTRDEALAMLEELAVFNRERSAAIGRRSVFDSERFVEFHRSLIGKCLPTGAVQLMRVSAGAETIGVVYHLVHEGKIYYYQCGFRYTDDNRLSPGTVTLSLVIQHCLDRGFDEYDFLSGDAKYKQWMSTGSRQLVWAVLRRPSLKLSFVSRLRSVKRRIAGSGS